nr:hypothetical protein [Tanacetum cinerariifolium]
NLFPPLDNPELTIQRRSRSDPTLLNNSEMAAKGPGDLPVPDFPTMKELCQPSLNGRGGPIALISIQTMNFGLKNDTIQQVQNSCQFHGLSDGQNVSREIFSTFNGHKAQNEITNFRQRPNESLFEAWEHYKLSIDRCPNHNMLPVTQIDTFYNGLTLRHRYSINAAAGGTFMKRPQWSESSSSITSSSDTEIAALKAEMAEINKKLMRPLLAIIKTYMLQEPTKIPQPQVVTTNEFTNFIKANYAILKNMQTNMTCLKNLNLELKKMFGQFIKMNTASSLGLGTIPGNTINNPKEDLKGITTRSRTAYPRPTIPTTSSSPIVERETEATKDMVHATNNGSTKDVQPSIVMTKSLILNSEPVNSPIIEPFAYPVSAPRPNQRPSIPYPSRLQNRSSVTKLTINCLAVLLKKLLKKLRDPDKFLIPCDFPEMAECLALADLGATINLIPLSVWNKPSLPNLSPTCMTLELVDRSISRPVGVAKDVFVKVGTFHFLADFVVVDFDADPRVPLILGRSFLKTERALIDVFEVELTLRVGKEAITFNLDQASRYLANYNDMMANRIDMACEEYSQEVLDFSDVIASSNPTPYYDPIVSTTSLTLTPFENSDFLLEEVDAFLAIKDDPTLLEVEVELKDLPPHLEYAFLEGDDKLPVIIAKDLSIEEKTALITVLKSHKRAIAWKLSDIKDMLSHLKKMLKRCEDTKLCLNWEKSHFMVKEGIVLDHKISKEEIEVDKAKVDVITKLPHPTTVKEFTFKVIDIKGAENLAADHLSRQENPHQNVLDPKEIIESFPLETLNLVSTHEAVYTARKPLTFSRLATMDPPGDTMAQITQPRRGKKEAFKLKDAKKSNEMYYPRDDQMFTMIKLVSRHQNTQQFGAMLHVELTNEDIRNSAAYKEYYAIASGEAPPKTKASVKKTQSSFDTTMPPLTATGTRLSTSAKGKQPAKSSKAKDEATGIIPRVPIIPTYKSDEEISWKSSDKDDDDVDDKSEQDDDDQDSDNDSDNFIHPKLSTHDEEAKDEKYTHVTLTLVNPDGQQQSLSVSSQFVTSMLNPSPDTAIDSLFESTHWVDVSVTTTVEPLLLSAPTLPPPSIPIISQVQQAPAPSPTTAPSTSLLDLPDFSSLFGFDHHLKTLEANFSEFMQTNQFAEASDRLRDETQAKNEYFLNKLDENIQKIIKEQVKEQVKVQVSKILPKIKNTVNVQLEAKVLTRASNSSKTSYVVAVDQSELELKQILIEKMKSNKSIHRSNEQRNLYKALVDSYKRDKIILDTYGDTGSKRRQARKEPELTSAPKEKASKTSSKSTERSKSHQKTASESAPAGEPMQTTQDLEELAHLEFETGAADVQPVAEASQHPECDLAKQDYSRTSFNELMDTPVDFSAFLMNWLKVDTLTPELLADPTYEQMKGSCKSLVELKFFLKEVYKATTDQLDWNNPKGQQYPYNLLKPLPLIPNSRGRRVIPFDHFINNDLEYLRGGASSQKYTTFVIKTKAANYGHIKWIEDLIPRTMWIQALTNYDKYALWGISHWGRKRVKSYQKKLDLTNLNTYKSDLKSKEAYTAYSNPRGFIYQNKDKQLRLMRIDELHKFSNDTLNDVRTALDDCLKGIRMKYLPQSIWRRSDKERAAAMIQDIDKQLKTMRIIRSLEKFIGGRLYEGDFRMLQQTI